MPRPASDAATRRACDMRGPGGAVAFCYELNGLFAALLRALDFDVAMLSANAVTAAGAFGPDFDHMTLLVPLAERWLVDVGFGDSFLEPLRLDERGEQVQGRRAYRIDAGGDERLTLLQRGEGGEWAAQYRFGLEPHVYADYAGMCRHHPMSPASHFTQRRVCSLATPEGRITLSEMRLITTRDGGRQERELAGEREVAAALREHFAIALPGESD